MKENVFLFLKVSLVFVSMAHFKREDVQSDPVWMLIATAQFSSRKLRRSHFVTENPSRVRELDVEQEEEVDDEDYRRVEEYNKSWRRRRVNREIEKGYLLVPNSGWCLVRSKQINDDIVSLPVARNVGVPHLNSLIDGRVFRTRH